MVNFKILIIKVFFYYCLFYVIKLLITLSIALFYFTFFNKEVFNNLEANIIVLHGSLIFVLPVLTTLLLIFYLRDKIKFSIVSLMAAFILYIFLDLRDLFWFITIGKLKLIIIFILLLISLFLFFRELLND